MNPYVFLWHCPFKSLCKSFQKWLLTPWGHEWLCAVWYPTEIFQKIRITRRNLNQNWKYFYPLLSGPARLDLWKKTGPKSHLTVPLIRIWKSRMTRLGMNMIPWGDWLCTVWFRFFCWINQWKLNQNQTNFNPLVSGPGWFNWWTKLEVKNLVGLSL